MSLQVVYHLVAAAACVAISYGVNQHQKPVYDPSYPAGLYTEQQGTLQLSYHGESLSFPMMSAQLGMYEVERLGRVFSLSELLLRATAPREQQARLEIYVDVGRNVRSDPRSLVQIELPIARSGRFGARPSLLQLDDGKLRHVISGNLLLTEVVPTESGEFRAAGRLELQVEGPSGVELITGRLEGRLGIDSRP
jgi:hypothetical protein